MLFTAKVEELIWVYYVKEQEVQFHVTSSWALSLSKSFPLGTSILHVTRREMDQPFQIYSRDFLSTVGEGWLGDRDKMLQHSLFHGSAVLSIPKLCW